MTAAETTPGDFIQSEDNPTIPQFCVVDVNHSKQAKSKIIKASDSCDGMDFDELLPYVGEFGLYQKRLFALMIPFTTFLPWVYFVQIFITLVPTGYWCRIPELANLTQEQRIALGIPPPGEYDDAGISQYSRCSMYSVNFTDILRDYPIIPTANRSWPVHKCQNGWEYNFTDVPYETIATEDNWVCDQAMLSFAAQSIFFVGAIVGCLIFGRIADRYGRIPALVGANMVACLSGILTTFTKNFWQFALCRFFFGLAFDNCFAMMYILVLEYVGPQWRTFVANMSIAIFFTMSSSALPWIAYYVSDWRLTSLVVSVPMIVTIATPWLIPESARWLASQGQVDQAIDILKKMEKINGTHVPDGVYKQFKESCELETKAEEGQSYSVINLFKSPRLRKTMILLIIIWMLISLVFDGHVRNINNLGLDIFLTFSIAAATEFPADVFLTLVLDRWGRRWIAFGLMCVSGIFSIWACAVTDNIFSAGLAIVGRFCMNITYNIGLQYAAELLPTVVRAQGVTLIHVTGFIASIISPFIVYLAKVSPFLPLLLLGIFGLIGGILVLLLPETLDQDLPQTLQDGEDFGKNQGFWDMPCLVKKADKGLANFAAPNSHRNASTRSAGRLPLRGEILRSSIIVKSSVKSRKNIVNIPEEVSKL